MCDSSVRCMCGACEDVVIVVRVRGACVCRERLCLCGIRALLCRRSCALACVCVCVTTCVLVCVSAC